jgi:STE24 endopeptidase
LKLLLRSLLPVLFAAALLLGGADQARAESAAVPAPAASSAPSAFRIEPVDAAWYAALPMEPEAATQAWLARIPAESRARSDAYFEGGYWLLLWNFLLGLAIAALLLASKPSTALRSALEKRLRWRFISDAAYGAAYAVAGWALSLPLTVYQGFVREHAYGMATQTFGAWFGEQLTNLAVEIVLSALALAVLYAVLRRAGARWWWWGALTSMVLLVVLLVISPIYINPLFNTYKPVENGGIKAQVLAMARADGVPADNVYEFDASRQTTRVSANVSGIFGSAAVHLNDNLLRRSSLAEIRAVMGHEIGHYTLNHMAKMLVQLLVVVALGFAFTAWAMNRLLARYGARWRVGGVTDVATFPLMTAVFSVYTFVATPVLNTMIRTQETEADYFGVNTAREPLGMAEVTLKLVEYRKASPGALEEFVFFDHPSAHNRILMVMRWRQQMQYSGALPMLLPAVSAASQPAP